MAIKRFSGLGDISSIYSIDRDRISVQSIDDVTNYEVSVSNEQNVQQVSADNIVRQEPQNAQLEITSNEVSTEIVESNYSDEIYFDTLFNSFNLNVEPVYNYWTEDEEINDGDDIDGRNLIDVPRYMRISWNIAPKIYDGSLYNDFERVRFGSNNSFRKFVDGPTYGIVDGFIMTPDHLQPRNFDIVVNSLANGYFTPGFINASFERPNFVQPMIDDTIIESIDEDEFLLDDETEGISLQELIANFSSYVSNDISVANGVNVVNSHNPFIEDRDIEFPSRFLDLRTTIRNSPIIGYRIATAGSIEHNEVAPVVQGIRRIMTQTRNVFDAPTNFVNATLIDTSVNNLFDDDHVNSITTPHAIESITAMSHIAPYIDVIRRTTESAKFAPLDIPSFPSFSHLEGVRYVGYILQKYKQNESGTFDLVEEILLPNVEYNNYYDSKIAYGSVYRYRIKSVVMWTRKESSSSRRLHNVDDFRVTEQSGITYVSSYFSGRWSSKWSYASVIDLVPPAHPDELNVIPFSNKKQIVVTMKIPYNSQRDISKMRIYRKLMSERNESLTDWKRVYEGSTKNTMFIDSDVDFFEDVGVKYVYAATAVSMRGEESLLSEQISAMLTKFYDERGEFDQEFVSCANVSLKNFGAYSFNPVKKRDVDVVVSDNNNDGIVDILFKVRDSLSTRFLNNSNYIIRIESLKTGEKLEFGFDINYVVGSDDTTYIEAIGNVATDTTVNITPLGRILRNMQNQSNTR